MKQYDIEYGGGGGYITMGPMSPKIKCHTCKEEISLDKEKYFVSRKLTITEKIKELFGKKMDDTKVETRYLCQQCHREEQLEKII